MATELYLFKIDGVYKGFTPTLFSKTLSGITYYPAIIKCSSIQRTDNTAKSPVTFTFDAANTFAQSMVTDLPETPISVTIYRDSAIYWSGFVIDAARTSTEVINVNCDSRLAITMRGGKRYRMNLHCNHSVYSPQCGVVDSSFVTSKTATATSSVINVPGLTQPSGYFNNGKASMFGQTRRIISSNGTTIKLSSPFLGNLTGTILLYPGCNGTRDNCIAFNNIANGLFFHKQSSKNPYGSTGLL